MRGGWRRAAGAALLAIALVPLAGASVQPALAAGSMTMYRANANDGIAAGPDGNLWFTNGFDRVGKMTTDGAATDVYVAAGSDPRAITAGPDGNLWFTSSRRGSIVRITPGGTTTWFPVPSGSPQVLGAITVGPDGNLWFTEAKGRIGRISTGGAITEFNVPVPSSEPWGITAGPDRHLWFTELFGNKVGRISTSGAVTEFPVPTADSQPRGITAGPSGDLWFTEFNAGKIGRITTSGAVTEFAIPTPASGPWGITSGPDGNLWFTEDNVAKVARMATTGAVTEFEVPGLSSSVSALPADITPGPDGNVWFTDRHGQIGKVTPAWSLRASASVQHATNPRGDTVTVTIPATVAGDALVLAIEATGFDAVPSVTGITDDGATHATYVRAVEDGYEFPSIDAAIWYAANVPTGITRVTLSWNAGSVSHGSASVWVGEYRGLAATGMLDATSVQEHAGVTAHSTGRTPTTTATNELVVALYADSGNGYEVGAPGSPWHLRLRADGNLLDQQLTADRYGSTMSRYSATFATPVPDYSVCAIATFRPS